MFSDASFTRKFSLSDLVYAASGYQKQDENQPIIQLVVAGVGEIPASQLRIAAEKLPDYCPIVRARLKGRWGLKRWSASGPLPDIKVIRQEWDGDYHSDSSFLDRPVDLKRGPVAEIIHVVGCKCYLVFRIHHAVTDGVGMLEFAKHFFNLLDQSNPQTATLEPFDSRLVLEKMPHGNLQAIPPKVTNAAVPFPLNQSRNAVDEKARIWRRLSLPGKDNKLLLKTMLAVAAQARSDTQETIRIHMPVNLRRYKPNERTMANLIGMVRIDVSPDDTCNSLVKKINKLMDERQELPIAVNSLTSKLTFWVPLFLLRRLEKLVLSKLMQNPRFSCSGTTSHLGHANLSDYSAAGFRAESVYAIPAPPMGSPLIAVMMTNDVSSEIIISANRNLISDDTMNELVIRLRSQIQHYGTRHRTKSETLAAAGG